MRIWKYTLKITDLQTVAMPPGARVLSVQMQGADPQMWALVDEQAPRRELRSFATYGTGNPIPVDADLSRFVSMYQMGPLVFHVFDAS